MDSPVEYIPIMDTSKINDLSNEELKTAMNDYSQMHSFISTNDVDPFATFPDLAHWTNLTKDCKSMQEVRQVVLSLIEQGINVFSLTLNSRLPLADSISTSTEPNSYVPVKSGRKRRTSSDANTKPIKTTNSFSLLENLPNGEPARDENRVAESESPDMEISTKTSRKMPPIIIHDAINWVDLTKELKVVLLNDFHGSVKNGHIRLQTKTVEDYRSAVHHLDSRKIQHHFFFCLKTNTTKWFSEICPLTLRQKLLRKN